MSLLRRGGDQDREMRAAQARADKAERALEKARRAAWKDESPQLVALDYPRADIQLNAATKLARKRKNASKKEPFTVEWIESHGAGEVLYDIGANVGAYSLIAAKRPQGALKVVAFEPGFATFALLCSNIVINECGADIVPLSVVLGDETRLGSFGYSDLSGGAALHAGGIEAEGEVRYAQPVLVERLDELVPRFGLPQPNHLKIDVDGAELAVLRGARGVLERPELRSVLVELSTDDDGPADELLRAAGLERVEDYRRRAESDDDAAGEDRHFWYALYRRP